MGKGTLSTLKSWLGVLVPSRRASSWYASGWGELHMSLLYYLLSFPSVAYTSSYLLVPFLLTFTEIS